LPWSACSTKGARGHSRRSNHGQLIGYLRREFAQDAQHVGCTLRLAPETACENRRYGMQLEVELRHDSEPGAPPRRARKSSGCPSSGSH
jgi:hypothetical protein